MPNWTRLIEEVHQELLRREALPAELAYWRQHFAAGGSEQAMRREIAASHEFQFEQRQRLAEGGEAAWPGGTR